MIKSPFNHQSPSYIYPTGPLEPKPVSLTKADSFVLTKLQKPKSSFDSFSSRLDHADLTKKGITVCDLLYWLSSVNRKFRRMSAGGAFGGNRGARPVPPEKGVFPLDHMHLCDLEKKDYIQCLKSEGHNSEKCRKFSKMYLECRMEKNLMARQDMSELGFREDGKTIQASENEVCDPVKNI